LLEVNNAVVSHLGLEDLFPAVSTCLRKVVQHDGSALILHDPQTRRYRVHVLSFAKNESFIEEGICQSDCRTPAGMAITAHKPAVLGEHDLKGMAADSECAKYWVGEGVSALCTVPLPTHDRVLGALEIGRRGEETLGPEEVELLGEVAKQIALAVENAQA